MLPCSLAVSMAHMTLLLCCCSGGRQVNTDLMDESSLIHAAVDDLTGLVGSAWWDSCMYQRNVYAPEPSRLDSSVPPSKGAKVSGPMVGPGLQTISSSRW
jgi:hypothetical protein